MNQSKRLVFYLMLNVLLSACTILTVLWIWDRPGKPLQNLLTGEPVPAATEPAGSAPGAIESTPTTGLSLKPENYPTGLIVISNIIGAGSASDEKVTIERRGAGQLSMSGWKLEDTNGNVFVFPDLTLYENGAIIIHTGAGMNTVIDLYWNETQSVWQEGETATLLDPLGNIQATYRIP